MHAALSPEFSPRPVFRERDRVGVSQGPQKFPPAPQPSSHPLFPPPPVLWPSALRLRLEEITRIKGKKVFSASVKM
jgi:hypothetical protein